MMVRVIYLVFISLSLFLAGCADDNSNSSSSNQNISGDGTVGGTGSVANVKEYFTADYACQFFDTQALMKLLDDHFHGKANNQRKIWTVFTFLTWYKRFFIDEAA